LEGSPEVRACVPELTRELLLLSPDGTYGVRPRLKGHAQFRRETWNKAFGELKVEPLEQCGEE